MSGHSGDVTGHKAAFRAYVDPVTQLLIVAGNPNDGEEVSADFVPTALTD